jgi:hypothetical protein
MRIKVGRTDYFFARVMVAFSLADKCQGIGHSTKPVPPTGISSRLTGYAEVIPVNPTAPLLPACRQFAQNILSLPQTPFLDREGHFSAMDTTNLAIRPAHLFEVIEAGIVSCSFLGHVYELHEPLSYWVVLLFSASRRFISATICLSTTNRSCSSLAVLAFRNSSALTLK